ncbi:MAG: cation:proton antiporter [Pseudomonadota bacterium]
MKRATLYYLATLVLAAAAIVGVLHLGSVFPAGAQVPTAGTAGGTGSLALLTGLAANLREPLSHLFVQLLVIILASRVISGALQRIGMPAVVGEMTAGILLGPSLFGLVAPEAFAFVFPKDSLGALKLLSQVGVCLYMFAVGMDLDIGHVRKKAQAAVAVSHASIVAPFVLGVALAYFLYESLSGPRATFTGFALFMGISMSITAFPVLARILQERGLSKTFLGSTAIACAAVDDVTAWTMLAFVVAIVGSASMATSVVTLVLSLLFVAVMAFLVRPAVPRILGKAGLAQEDPSTGTLALVICVVLAGALSTELIGIHALFGAFVAGAVMPEADGFRDRIRARVEKFSSALLLPLFFVYTGLRTQLGLLDDLQGWMICLLIVAVATVGKLGASTLAARVTGIGWRESLQLGALMNTRGLMELIALNIGYDMGILSPRIFTMLVIMALATTVMTGPLLTLFQARRSADGRMAPARVRV